MEIYAFFSIGHEYKLQNVSFTVIFYEKMFVIFTIKLQIKLRYLLHRRFFYIHVKVHIFLGQIINYWTDKHFSGRIIFKFLQLSYKVQNRFFTFTLKHIYF